MTSTEALIVLAYRANISMLDIAHFATTTIEHVEQVIQTDGGHPLTAVKVLAEAVAG